LQTLLEVKMHKPPGEEPDSGRFVKVPHD